jgi:hypothetical protein
VLRMTNPIAGLNFSGIQARLQFVTSPWQHQPRALANSRYVNYMAAGGMTLCGGQKW